MSDETPVFWGCTIAHTLPYIIPTTRNVLEKIGVKTREIPGWTCCPDPVSAKAYDHDISLTLSARNMALAGENMMIACNGCYNTFLKAHKELEYPHIKEKINKFLDDGEKYKDTKVDHLLDTLANKSKLIQGKIKKPLKGLKVAVHYGCHALWPQAVKSDHPDNPSSIDDIIKILGAESADYPAKFDCCGVPIAAFAEEEADQLLSNKLKSAKENADCMVTPCPTCFLQFDRLSKDMKENAIPVFYITELIGLAMGATPEEMNLNMHATSVAPALEKLGIAYDAEKNTRQVKDHFDWIELNSHCEACRLECTQAQITKGSENHFDPLDLVDTLLAGKLDEAINDPDVWRCLQCGKCLARCPNNIGLKDMFMKLREVAIEKGKTPRAVEARMEMIKSSGYGIRANPMVRKRIGMSEAAESSPGAVEKIIKKTKKKNDDAPN